MGSEEAENIVFRKQTQATGDDNDQRALREDGVLPL